MVVDTEEESSRRPKQYHHHRLLRQRSAEEQEAARLPEAEAGGGGGGGGDAEEEAEGSAAVTPYIVGGTPAAAGAYPSFAHPHTSNRQGYGLCGAVLVHADVLLTAGHCESAFRRGTAVHLGGTQLSGTDAFDTIETVATLVHPRHNGWTLDRDLLLVQLERAAVTGTATASVPIAPYNTDANHPAPNAAVTVIGYGLTEEDGVWASDVLRHVDVTVRSQAECRAAYGSEFFPDSMLCASSDNGSGGDSCQGDRCVLRICTFLQTSSSSSMEYISLFMCGSVPCQLSC